jgi:hypothetical protein
MMLGPELTKLPKFAGRHHLPRSRSFSLKYICMGDVMAWLNTAEKGYFDIRGGGGRGGGGERDRRVNSSKSIWGGDGRLQES